jgi:hypothetical protein
MTELREGFTAVQILLCNHAAGDAVAGVTRGIRFVVIGLRVDHDGRAAVAEERMRPFTQGHVVILESDSVGFALGVDGEVFHVARVVPLRIVESVLLGLRVEVRARGFEIGRIALGVLMEVDGVLAGRQAIQMQFEFNA